ncbi:putrescine hydroxycinnamoyltransferase 1-like [Dioscorea cayenensis subsp. rotundata]|uniref:Putrescine hydroxycinnamoyltransferase 1-like n=1 Tax=Dioscorea cayennensis subsp. rotundata TaxID=55577 RepID=A0AB40ATP8_DIOCR|nr:putrescine hydroxycinnamoyltransferase 1-like [Dioscorea cayenensis subsp. rotundata]
MEPKVEIIETHIVPPNKETPKHKLWLSNLDKFAPRDHAPTIYIYKPNSDNPDSNFFSVETLKNSLSKALVIFYPFAGRLVLNKDGRPEEVDCNAEGALLSVAQAHCTLDSFGDFRPSSTVRELLVPSVNEPDRSPILMLFQVTFFKCGGVCLGCTMQHNVMDGVGALHFINSWSEIARCVAEENVVKPFLDRSALKARTPPSVVCEHEDYTSDLYCKRPSLGGLEKCETAILKITKEQLSALKVGTKGLSTFKAVSVHLWRTVCKVRGLSKGEDVRLYMAADARDRLEPPLPKGYSGNAILSFSTSLPVEDLLSNSFRAGVAKIEESMLRLNDEYIRSLVDFLEVNKDNKDMVLGSRAMGPGDFLCISWLALPIYDADFGWGKPCFMCRASMRFASQSYVMRSPGNTGGVHIAFCFEPENMARFKEIFYKDLVVEESLDS